MATIYEITSDIIDLLGTEEEVPDEVWASQTGQQMIAKVDNYCHLKVNLDASILAHENEIERLKRRVEVMKRNRAKMLSRLKDCLEAINVKKLQTDDKLFTVKIVNNPPRVIIDDQQKIPPDCIYIIPEQIVTNKNKLREYILAGKDVGAHLEAETRLDIR